jgi:hypothetical protein
MDKHKQGLKMSNPILIHVNRKFHIPLDNILKIVQKRHGKVYVYFNDGKSARPKIAIAKQDAGSLLTIVNTYKLMRGNRPILLIKE